MTPISAATAAAHWQASAEQGHGLASQRARWAWQCGSKRGRKRGVVALCRHRHARVRVDVEARPAGCELQHGALYARRKRAGQDTERRLRESWPNDLGAREPDEPPKPVCACAALVVPSQESLGAAFDRSLCLAQAENRAPPAPTTTTSAPYDTPQTWTARQLTERFVGGFNLSPHTHITTPNLPSSLLTSLIPSIPPASAR